MAELNETIQRLQSLKSDVQNMRDKSLRLSTQIESDKARKSELLDQLEAQGLTLDSAKELVQKIVVGVNAALDKVETFLERRDSLGISD